VAHLVHSEHTFVLAGTGFGKSRIAEIYLRLFKPYQKPVIVVLNPLDALGDNQVRLPSIVNAFAFKNGNNAEVLESLTYRLRRKALLVSVT
jgi:superfamily II DNA helicase RecQ